jgi:hypothetical protein
MPAHEMESAIIHHDAIVAPQHWNQAAFDIGENISPVMPPFTTIGAIICCGAERPRG